MYIIPVRKNDLQNYSTAAFRFCVLKCAFFNLYWLNPIKMIKTHRVWSHWNKRLCVPSPFSYVSCLPITWDGILLFWCSNSGFPMVSFDKYILFSEALLFDWLWFISTQRIQIVTFTETWIKSIMKEINVVVIECDSDAQWRAIEPELNKSTTNAHP